MSKHGYSNKLGFSLVEVMIAVGIMAILALGLTNLLSTQMKTVRRLEVKVDTMDLKREVDMFFKQSQNCVGSFVQGNSRVPFVTDGSDPSYNISFNRLLVGGRNYISGGQVASYPRLAVTDMKLRSKGVPSESSNILIGGVSTPVQSHFVDLEMYIQDVHNSIAVFLTKIPLKIYTDNSSNEVIQCISEPKTQILTASMKRTGFTIQRKYCLESVPNSYYEDNTSTCNDHNGDGLIDANEDGLCDAAVEASDANWKPLKAHPWTDSSNEKNLLWQQYFPVRNPDNGASVNLLSPQREGRCRAEAKYNDSAEPYSEIFVLHNAEGSFPYPASGSLRPVAEGIGCNESNGWRLLNCSIQNYGTNGDSDISVLRDGGNSYCVTNDHYQPHEKNEKGGVWNIKSVGVTASCFKVVD